VNLRIKHFKQYGDLIDNTHFIFWQYCSSDLNAHYDRTESLDYNLQQLDFKVKPFSQADNEVNSLMPNEEHSIEEEVKDTLE
jgi:hypothetical protein